MSDDIINKLLFCLLLGDARRRHRSVITAPDPSQLVTSHTRGATAVTSGSNGLSRRNRSNSAPAVLEIEREVGRQLREISDQFNMTSGGGGGRGASAAAARRTSTVRACCTSSSLCLSLFLLFAANVIVIDLISFKSLANYLADLPL